MNVGSTRGGTADLPLSDALLRGTAPDGGLYVPEKLPRGEVHAPVPPTLRASALAVLEPFFAGDRLAPDLPGMLDEAFTFPVGLVPLGGYGNFVVELFHGPTAAFKDFGARFLAACMRRLHPAQAGTRTVLVATSGDTGGAVASAFHRMPASGWYCSTPRGASRRARRTSSVRSATTSPRSGSAAHLTTASGW